jgi:hypothetical protein
MFRLNRYAVLALLVISLPACSLLGEPSNTPPAAALSKANLMAACESTSSNKNAEWLACTALSQATAMCQDLASGNPVDEQLIAAVEAFYPDPALKTIGGLSVAAVNAALAQWCTGEGYTALREV